MKLFLGRALLGIFACLLLLSGDRDRVRAQVGLGDDDNFSLASSFELDEELDFIALNSALSNPLIRMLTTIGLQEDVYARVGWQRLSGSRSGNEYLGSIEFLTQQPRETASSLISGSGALINPGLLATQNTYASPLNISAINFKVFVPLVQGVPGPIHVDLSVVQDSRYVHEKRPGLLNIYSHEQFTLLQSMASSVPADVLTAISGPGKIRPRVVQSISNLHFLALNLDSPAAPYANCRMVTCGYQEVSPTTFNLLLVEFR